MPTPVVVEAQHVVPFALGLEIGGKARVVAGSPGYLSQVGDRGKGRRYMSSINTLCTCLTCCCGIIGRGCLLSGMGGGSVQETVLWNGMSQGCILAANSELSEVSKEFRLMIMGGS